MTPLPIGTRIAFLDTYGRFPVALARKTADDEWIDENDVVHILSDRKVREFRSIRLLPLTLDEHYERLNVYPADPVVGEKWEIEEAVWWLFLEVLPPLAYTGHSFYMVEFYTGNITTRYSREGEKFYCEWAMYPPPK